MVEFAAATMLLEVPFACLLRLLVRKVGLNVAILISVLEKIRVVRMNVLGRPSAKQLLPNCQIVRLGPLA